MEQSKQPVSQTTKWFNLCLPGPHFQQGFKKLYDGQFGFDCTLMVEGLAIKVHKVVLASASDLFKEHVHNARNTPLIVHINDIKYSAMKTIVDFLYEGNVNVKEDDVRNFVTAAQYLQFDNIAPKIMKTCDVPTKTEAYKREAVMSLKPPAKKVKLIQPKVEEKPVLFVAHSFQPETELPEENQPFPVVCEYSEDEEKFINEHFKQRRNGRTYKNMKRSIKVPRPLNAFMIYAQNFRQKLAKEFPKDTNKLISVRLGECWKSMPNYSKAFYFEAAEDVKREHKKYYPSYYYNPMEARCKKIEKKNKKKSKHNFV